MINNYVRREMTAYEAFIRRASELNLPFMLKGSYVTRQYFKEPNDRNPADLDWVYLDTLEDEETARQKFTEWVTLVTEYECNDEVKFASFRENAFWRKIDYAMAQDFPTVNTDLECYVRDELWEFELDISFNLNIEDPPIPLLYYPVEGEPFVVPNSVPISLQVSWKIHQTLIRPRMKDLFDLMHLVQHPHFTKETLGKTLQALINECSVDNIDLNKLKYFLNFEIDKLFKNNTIEDVWLYWRYSKELPSYDPGTDYEQGEYLTDISKLPEQLSEFLDQFKTALQNAGIGIHLFENLPEPTRSKRKTFEVELPEKEPREAEVFDNDLYEIKIEKWTIAGFFKKIFG